MRNSLWVHLAFVHGGEVGGSVSNHRLLNNGVHLVLNARNVVVKVRRAAIAKQGIVTAQDVGHVLSKPPQSRDFVAVEVVVLQDGQQRVQR